MTTNSPKPNASKWTWAAQIVAAAILLMAIPPKFTGDPGAVAIFEQLGAEPFGRIATGIFESIAVLLLLVPRTAVFGGLFAAGLMSGAILSHFLVLGIVLDGDPSMFVMALVVFAAGLTVIGLRRHELRPLTGQSLDAGSAPHS